MHRYLASWIVFASIACGGRAPVAPPQPPAATSPEATSTEPAPTPAAATPKLEIGPDECCCPFASAEGVAYNVSPRDACEAAGTGCVAEESCAR